MGYFFILIILAGRCTSEEGSGVETAVALSSDAAQMHDEPRLSEAASPPVHRNTRSVAPTP